MKWKSPRCGSACWAEVKEADEEMRRMLLGYQKLSDKLAEVTADRDEWKQQHENLLVIYQASLQPSQ